MWYSVQVVFLLISLGNTHSVYDEDPNSINDIESKFDRKFDDVDALRTNQETIARRNNNIYSMLSNDLTDIFPASGLEANEPASDLRRKPKKKNKKVDVSGSSSYERINSTWEQEWKEKVRSEMENNRNNTTPRGDVVHMVSARPWGVPCGDTHQYRALWGSCLLPINCEAEYRIYRGDHHCGRTVCCALQVSSFDIVHGIPLGLDTEVETDTDTEASSGQLRENDREEQKKLKRRIREKRKKRMKKKVTKRIRDLQRKLKEISRNNTHKLHEPQKGMKEKIKIERKRIGKEKDLEQAEWDEKMEIQEQLMMEHMDSKFSQIAADIEPVRKHKSESYKSLRRRVPKHLKDYLEYDVEYEMLYV